jgi:hypothetical protein
MTVSELMTILSTMPGDARVGYVWDGHIRSDVHHVWLARNGKVALADDGDFVYDPNEAPVET